MRKKSVLVGILLLLIGGLFCFIYNPLEDYYERVDSNLKFKNTLYVVDQNHTLPENKIIKGKRIGKTSDSS